MTPKQFLTLCALTAVSTTLWLGAVSIVEAGTANLTWTANTEADLAGYKLYRGNGVCAPGPLQPLGAGALIPKPATSFTDTTVPNFDGTLCYELTAVDTAGNESPRSIRASKVVNLIPPSAPLDLQLVTVTP